MEPGLKPDQDVDKVTCPSWERLLFLVDTGHHEPCLRSVQFPWRPQSAIDAPLSLLILLLRSQGDHACGINPLSPLAQTDPSWLESDLSQSQTCCPVLRVPGPCFRWHIFPPVLQWHFSVGWVRCHPHICLHPPYPCRPGSSQPFCWSHLPCSLPQT